MGFQQTFLTALGEYLHTANVGVWQASGAYAKTDTAITIDELPTSVDKASHSASTPSKTPPAPYPPSAFNYSSGAHHGTSSQ